jgi:hypothetical protein
MPLDEWEAAQTLRLLIRGSWVRVPVRSPTISTGYRHLPFEPLLFSSQTLQAGEKVPTLEPARHSLNSVPQPSLGSLWQMLEGD